MGESEREREVCRVLACVWKASVERMGAEAPRLTQSSLGNRANETQTICLYSTDEDTCTQGQHIHTF